MLNVWWIMRREVGAFFKGWMGFIIIALVLAVDGLLFNAFAVGTGHQKSSQILENFFYLASGVHLTASIFIGMRLVAEEKQSGTPWCCSAHRPSRIGS